MRNSEQRPAISDYVAIVALIASAACQVADRGDETVPTSYGLGTAASPAEVAALNTDVSPSGEGLSSGEGDAETGEKLYQVQCASCHGTKGEGVAPYPPLVGREPREGFPFGNDPKAVRTVGNYWPEATSLFDYIKRTMPLNAPGSLSDNDVYSLTAHLLVANEILPAGAKLDSVSLLFVKMPARDRFVPDNRRGGREVR